MMMKLERGPYGDGFLPIPDIILEHLGWKEGDTLFIDIPFPHDGQIVVWKVKDSCYENEQEGA